MVTLSRVPATKTDDDPSRLESPPPLATAATNDLESTAETGARAYGVSTEASRAGRDEFSSHAFYHRSPLAVLATSTTTHGAAAANESLHFGGHNFNYATTSNSSSSRVAESRSGNKRPHASAFSVVAEHEKMEQRMVKLCKSTSPCQQTCNAITAIDNDSSRRSHADVADFHPNQLEAFSIQAELASAFGLPSGLSTPLSPDITSRSLIENSVGFSTPCGIQHRIPPPDRCPGAPWKAPRRELVAHHSCTCVNTTNLGTGCRWGCMGFETGKRPMQRNVQRLRSDPPACFIPENDARTRLSPSQSTPVHTSTSTSSTRRFSMAVRSTHVYRGPVTYANVDSSPTAAVSDKGVPLNEVPHPFSSLRRLFRPLDFGCGTILC